MSRRAGRRPSQCGRVLLSFIFDFLFITSSFVSAQLVNGQFFTKGLAISDSPAPQSQVNAGSDLNVAIELSGDGKLPQDAFLPTSTRATAYQSLNLYLVSSDSNLNFTVSEGQLLQQEPGSTVKHLNWPIPACIPSGNYNLTIYELSRINQQSCYSITPIPIVVKSKSTSPCSGVPGAESQPQLSSPPQQQPWLAASVSTASVSTTMVSMSTIMASGSMTTVPAMPTATTFSGPGTEPVTPVFPSSGTLTITLSPSPTTVTFVSTIAVSTTLSGLSTVYTTETTVTAVSTVLSPSGSIGAFIPVNGVLSRRAGRMLMVVCVLLATLV